ncbi:MAG: type II toxin-antitoxin system RelE/ParE family toxin [Puniceicoccaceae bacterium]
MITSFACRETEKIFEGLRSQKLPSDIQSRARRRLIQLDNAQNINDMRIPPSNHLEKLSGDMAGSWSIRVNQQWRLVFLWEEGNATEVRIIDYH